MKKVIALLLALMLSLCAPAALAQYAYASPVDSLQYAQAGDIVTFGSYPQAANGRMSPIQWIVLERNGSQMLLISYYALDAVRYHRSNQNVTWAASDLRAWLNDQFYWTAFTEEEQAYICTAVNNTRDVGSRRGGGTTYDQVFLLSIDEALWYFPSDAARSAQPTQYAVSQGAYTSKAGNVWWWLRSPGDAQNRAAGVYGAGNIDYEGAVVDLSTFRTVVDTVRPVIWVDVDP